MEKKNKVFIWLVLSVLLVSSVVAFSWSEFFTGKATASDSRTREVTRPLDTALDTAPETIQMDVVQRSARTQVPLVDSDSIPVRQVDQEEILNRHPGREAVTQTLLEQLPLLQVDQLLNSMEATEQQTPQTGYDYSGLFYYSDIWDIYYLTSIDDGKQYYAVGFNLRPADKKADYPALIVMDKNELTPVSFIPMVRVDFKFEDYKEATNFYDIVRTVLVTRFNGGGLPYAKSEAGAISFSTSHCKTYLVAANGPQRAECMVYTTKDSKDVFEITQSLA